MWKQYAIVLVAALATLPVRAAPAFDHNHRAWSELLQRHVIWVDDGVSSQVDYPGFLDDKAELDAYLATLSGVERNQYEQWSKDRQLTFLINAYNAFTVKLILDHWPVDSIRNIGGWFRSPWKTRFFPLLGEARHLDWIEHEVIRKPGNFNEPRIHFAVNCAAIGCPALRPEAYVGDDLDSQLEDQTRRFLADRSRNRLDDETLFVSSIFKWYREDFQSGWQGINSLREFLLSYSRQLELPARYTDLPSMEQLDIEFLDYDWDLNSTD